MLEATNLEDQSESSEGAGPSSANNLDQHENSKPSDTGKVLSLFYISLV